MGDYQIQETEKSKLVANSGHILPEEFYTGKRELTLDRSVKALSAVGTGLMEGTIDKAIHFASSAKDNPLEAMLHVGSGAAVGIGLALANKKLALLAGAAGSADMLIRGIGAFGKSSDSVWNLATTGTGYENAKKAVSSNFGQLGADVLAMTATGAIVGGATYGGLKLKGMHQAKKAEVVQPAKPNASETYDFAMLSKEYLGGTASNIHAKADYTHEWGHDFRHLPGTLEHAVKKPTIVDKAVKTAMQSESETYDFSALSKEYLGGTPNNIHTQADTSHEWGYDFGHLPRTVEHAVKKPTMSLQVLSARETEHELTGLNFLNKKAPFSAETPSLSEGMTPLQVLTAVKRDADANKKQLDWGLNRVIAKFTDRADGDYIRMSAQGQSEMIHNLAQLSQNTSRSKLEHVSNLSELSKVHQFAGRHQQELKLLQEAQEFHNALPAELADTLEHRINLQRLADAYTAIGEPARAMSTAERLVQVSELDGVTEGLRALNNLGRVYNNVGATDKSLAAFQQAMNTCRERGRYDEQYFLKPNNKSLTELYEYFTEVGELDNAKSCLEIMDFWNS